MRTVSVIVAVAGVLGMGLRQPEPAALVITGARVYTAPDAVPIDDAVVVIEREAISAVGPRSSVTVPKAQRTIDGKGLVVTAGFQNSHVHFTAAQWSNAAAQPASVLTTQLQGMLTRYGFTTVVDIASDVVNTLSLRRRIVSGQVIGPRILTAGAALYPPNGVPFYVRNDVPPSVLKQLPQPTTVEEAAGIVQRQAVFGAVVLKLFTGSYVERGKVLPMPDDIAAAAVAEARRHGMVVFAHASNVPGLEVALRAGVDVLAHALDDWRGITPDHRKRMRAQNVGLVPTLKLFSTGRFLWEILDEVRIFSRSGGQILFGTDVGYLSDFDPTVEYELMAAAGLDWREILASLTTNPVQRFGEQANRGRIAPAMAGDLVLLGSDPALGARGFADVRYTIRDGRVIFGPSNSGQ